MIIRQFTVYGRVQGVGFRFHTLRQAQKLGIKGYVKNLAEGSVLVVAQGSPHQIENLANWLKQGSPSAKVTDIVEQQYRGESLFNEFIIKF